MSDADSPSGEVASSAEAAPCPRCKADVQPGEERTDCGTCASVHHARCWSEAGGRCALCGASAGGAGAAEQEQPRETGAPQATSEEAALALAERAIEDPLSPKRGFRCLRCGERAGPARKEDADEAEPERCPRCGVVLRSADAAQGVAPRGRWWTELLRGGLYLPRGAFLIVRRASLWKFAVVPLLLNIFVALLAVFIVDRFISAWLVKMTDASLLAQWEGWLWGTLSYIVRVLGWLVHWLPYVMIPILTTWLITAFPFNLLYKVVFMPFMEVLTEAAERGVLDIQEDIGADLARIYNNLVLAIVDAGVLTLLQGGLYVLLLPINILPFLGSFLWLIAPPALFAGVDYSDVNLVRRRYFVREKIGLWRTHKWRFLGFGLAFFFLLAVPVVNCFVIPAASAGGALLYLGLDRK